MRHLGTRTLHTPRLTLRQFQPEDSHAMFKNWASRDAVTRYMTWPSHPGEFVTESIVSAWCALYDDPHIYNWAIVLRESGELIGNISCISVSEQDERCEIGYCLSDDYWNRGIMSEALAAVMEYLFLEVGAHKIKAWHAKENPASGRVMEKCGLRREGVLIGEQRNKTGGFYDIVVYGLVREAYAEMRTGK